MTKLEIARAQANKELNETRLEKRVTRMQERLWALGSTATREEIREQLILNSLVYRKAKKRKVGDE